MPNLAQLLKAAKQALLPAPHRPRKHPALRVESGQCPGVESVCRPDQFRNGAQDASEHRSLATRISGFALGEPFGYFAEKGCRKDMAVIGDEFVRDSVFGE